MEQWSAEHRAFVVKAFFKSGDSCVAVQRQFRGRFDVGPRGRVPTRNTIVLWSARTPEKSSAAGP
ncbi:hypothetical protein J6590_023148 [Homalodisca vitripennis]|nr:hypothetical protein J6590_023148 [Homalodisca vitripennis]